VIPRANRDRELGRARTNFFFPQPTSKPEEAEAEAEAVSGESAFIQSACRVRASRLSRETTLYHQWRHSRNRSKIRQS
jgi:hypothetical protein